MRSALQAAACQLRLCTSAATATSNAAWLTAAQLLQRQESVSQCSTSQPSHRTLTSWSNAPWAPSWSSSSSSSGASRGYARGARPSDRDGSYAGRRGRQSDRDGGERPDKASMRKFEARARSDEQGRVLRIQQDTLRLVRLGRLPTNAAAPAPKQDPQAAAIQAALAADSPGALVPFTSSYQEEQRNEEEADFLELMTGIKEQIERSNLPPEFKKAMFGSGHAWNEVLIEAKRTAKVTKAGRLESYHGLIVVGNYDGMIGIGSTSGRNLQQVMMDSYFKAFQNLVPIPRYRCHTVYHMIDSQFHGVRVQMWPRPRGFGITASDLMHELCQMAGITDVTVKVTGRRKNRVNLLRAWLDGLTQQSLPHEGVEGSGTYVREILPGKKLPFGLKRGVHVP